MADIRVAIDLAEASDEERDEFEDIRADAGAERSEEEAEALGLDPLTATIVIGGGVVIARTLAGLWERWKGGTIVEITDQGLSVKRSREISFGYFVIKGKDGSVEVKAVDEAKDALERMGEGILKLPLDATVEQIKATIEAAQPQAETRVNAG